MPFLSFIEQHKHTLITSGSNLLDNGRLCLPLWFPPDKRFIEVRHLTCVGDGFETAENNGRDRLKGKGFCVCVPEFKH